MLANTLTVTINGVAKILTRHKEQDYSSEYRLYSSLEALVLKIRHSSDKTAGFEYSRHNVDLSWVTYATTLLPEYHYHASQTFRTRTVGGDPTVLAQTIAGLATLVNAQAAALCQGEP